MLYKQSVNIDFCYPLNNEMLLRKQRALRRELLAREGISYIQKKIAILGGATISDLKNMLEIFLLFFGIQPCFYESEYNKYYEEAVFQNDRLKEFGPDIILIFTGVRNLLNVPELTDSTDEVQRKLESEYQRYEIMWKNLLSKYSAVVIQNNFDPPLYCPEGNLDAVLLQGINRFVNKINEKFADFANRNDGFYVHDLSRVAYEIGLNKWNNQFQYHAYKLPMNYDVIPDVAWNMTRLIRTVLGKIKKVLVLDLDNTMWGGVIGDEGVNNITLGHETPMGEAFIEWQKYIKHLKNRGVLLAVCSKNDEEIAKEGFKHPDSVLSIDDFVAFHANWEPKDINIRQIAKELNLGIDSFVFIDDNPVERAIVRESLPDVAVPEIDPQDISSYILAIEKNGYFDAASLSNDDFKRSQAYHENREREELAASMVDYEEFLKMLQMKAEVGAFCDVYIERIAQLTNKTNQFNLTTQRYTVGQIKQIMSDDKFITIYCRMKDKYGDNGLISEIIAEVRGKEAHVLLWLMSCRVLKRGVEILMLDELVARARKNGCEMLVGYYFPTAKNKMVESMYSDFGFDLREMNNDGAVWDLSIAEYECKNKLIDIQENIN